MKILLVKLNHIGDTLLLTPTIRFIRERYPDAEIDVVTRRGCESVLEGNPGITNLIPVASPEKNRRSLLNSASEFLNAFRAVFCKRYDYAFDLSNSDRAKFWILMSCSRKRAINGWHARLGIKRFLFNRFTDFAWGGEHQVLKDFRAVADIIEPSASPGPLYINTDIDTAGLEEKIPFLPRLDNYALIHPVSRWAFKEWVPERWAEVSDWLTKTYGCAIVFSSGPDGNEQAYIRNILRYSGETHYYTEGLTTLREFAYVAKGARLFLGVDTVAMHIAAAVQTPTVALFGPSSEWSWRPWQCRHELVLGDCSCKTTRKFVCDKSRPYPCMEKIQTGEVMDAVRRLMDENGR